MRVFLAINLPPAIKQELADWQTEIKNSFPMETAEAVAKWVAPENLHLTLLFLGEVGDREIPFLIKAVRAVVKDTPFFVLRLTKAGYGPAKKIPPQFIWLEAEENKILEKLAANLQKEIGQAGQEFFGHITLGRIQEWVWQRIDPDEQPEVAKEFDMKIEVRSVEMMDSQLKRSGPTYTILQSFPLLGLD